jgi:hypothetical protein
VAAQRLIPPIPAEYIVRLKNAPSKEFILAEGLLYLAHLQNIKRCDVQVIQAPTPDAPYAIVRCEVETDLGVFADFGEVGPGNRNPVAKEYPLSMASTRARNRALRIATGCPLTSYEEMGMDAEPRQEDDEGPRPLQSREDPQTAPATEKMWSVLRARVIALGGEYVLPQTLTVQEAWAHLRTTDELLNAMKKQEEERAAEKVKV